MLLLQFLETLADLVLIAMPAQLLFDLIAAQVLQRARGQQFVYGGGARLHSLDLFLRAMDSLTQVGDLTGQSGERPLRFILRFGGRVAGGKKVAAGPESLHGRGETAFGLTKLLLLGTDFFQLAAQIRELPVRQLTAL